MSDERAIRVIYHHHHHHTPYINSVKEGISACRHYRTASMRNYRRTSSQQERETRKAEATWSGYGASKRAATCNSNSEGLDSTECKSGPKNAAAVI